MQKERLFCLSEGQDCCPCITLHIPLFLYVQLGVYKLILKVESSESCTDAGLPHVVLFSPFSAEFPSGAGRLTTSTYLSRLLRSVRERAQGGGTLRYSNGRRWPNVDGTSSLSGTLVAFHVNQVIQPPFLRLNFLLYHFFLI